ncbi:MAG: hypothetical protein ACOYMP_04420 [Nodosilinea sp.]
MDPIHLLLPTASHTGLKLRPAWVGACFLPAGLGLGWQLWFCPTLSDSILALGLLLGLLEQAHMARVDLEKVKTLGQHPDYGLDPRLYRFARVLMATLGTELLGFYLASFGYLGVGLVVIMLSLLGFNLAAGVQLETGDRQPIQAAPWHSRGLVLSLDGLGVAMGCLWLSGQGKLWVATGFLTLTLVYNLTKLINYGVKDRRTGAELTVKVTDPSQKQPETRQ